MGENGNRAATGQKSWGQLRREAGWLGIVAVSLWLNAIIVLLLYGGILSAVFAAIAGLMAWTPAFIDLRAQGKRTLSGGGRVAVGVVSALVSVVMHPASGEAGAPPVEAPPVISAADPVPAKASDSKAAAEQRREWAGLEKRNHAKIASLIGDEKTLASTDVEGKLAFWQDITALAPGNKEYAERRDKLAAEVQALALYRDHPEDGAEVVKIAPHKAGFGNVLVVDITIRNRSLSHLKDFQIICSNMGPSGTPISESSRTLYEVVQARSTRTFPKVNMGLIDGQTASTNCRVDGASIH